MRFVVSAGLLVAAFIHLVPLVGVLGESTLLALYGIDASDPTLAILLRHRAVLFGVLGGFFAFAAFVPAYQVAALVMGAASAAAFVVIAWSTPGSSAAIATIVRGDLVAIAGLAVASIARGML
ncbi:MAG: phosphopantetheine adenylyltransferase [Kofleriaceae bacterium]